ncbi:MAG TPA: RNA polymerase sigma-70 factor [Bacteroidales bacterium]
MKDNIIKQFNHGNKDAYHLLFTKLYPVMCLFAEKFVHHPGDAEDISQEIFIELWHQRVKFESIDQVKAFLYLSVKNRCLNFSKHQRIKEKYTQTVNMNHDPSFEERIIEAEVIQHLHNAIESLPNQQKQVIIHTLEGLSNHEISENMQISLNTVKFHKKAAYQQLREKLGSASFILVILF